MNRNAKSPAFAAELPGVTYGELAGWGQSGDVTRQVLTLIELRHGGESQRTADLFTAVTAATDEVMADVLRSRPSGTTTSPASSTWPSSASSSRCTSRRRRVWTRVRLLPSTTRTPTRHCPARDAEAVGDE